MIPDSWQSVLLLVLIYFHFFYLKLFLSVFHSFFFLSLFLSFWDIFKWKISIFITRNYFPGNPLSMIIIFLPPPPPHAHPHPLLHSQISCALQTLYPRDSQKPMETTRCQTTWLSMAVPLSVYQPVFISIFYTYTWRLPIFWLNKHITGLKLISSRI